MSGILSVYTQQSVQVAAYSSIFDNVTGGADNITIPTIEKESCARYSWISASRVDNVIKAPARRR